MRMPQHLTPVTKLPQRGRPANDATDTDELSAGNAGFETQPQPQPRHYTQSEAEPVSYTHLTLPTTLHECRSRWSPYH